MRRLAVFVLDRWPWFAFLASAAMLGAAHGFERFGDLYPCTLCYRQREAHWAALGIAAAAIALSFVWKGRPRWLSGAALAVAYAYGTWLGFFHMGVEYHWWPGPTTCVTGPSRGVTLDDMNALLQGGRLRPPACDVAQWWFLGLSMAAWNGIICAALMIASAVAGYRRSPNL